MQGADAYFSPAFYFIDDYRLAILRRSGLQPRGESLVIYDTRGKANLVPRAPRLLLNLPQLGPGGAIGFYGPGETPSDEDAFFRLTDQEQSLLAIAVGGVSRHGLATTSFMVVSPGDLLALASRGGEDPVEFEEWKHLVLKAPIPPQLEGGILTVGVCGPAILVLELDRHSQYRLWVYDFSPGARRTSLASGQQQKYTLRHFAFQDEKILSNRCNLWTILPERIVLHQVSGLCHIVQVLLHPDLRTENAR
jgi:hypothetical protein